MNNNINQYVIDLSAANERTSPTRRQTKNSSIVASNVDYQPSVSIGSTPSYRVHAQSQPPSSPPYRDYPTKVVTQVTEETQVIQIPPRSSEHTQNTAISYTVENKKSQYPPVAFQVSTMKENSKPMMATTNDSQDPNPFKIFGAKLRSRPSKGIVPSYDDQNAENYNQESVPASQGSANGQGSSNLSSFGNRQFQQMPADSSSFYH